MGKVFVGEKNGNGTESIRRSTFDSQTTFHSYGVEHGDREGLVAAVPESHKEFLRNKVVFIHEQRGVDTGDPATSYDSLLAVHAGLEKDKELDSQLLILRNRDVTLGRHESLSGRKNVWENHPDLVAKGTLLVSGHHGRLHIEKNRLIIDESGGVEGRPIAAVILPDRIIVRHTDSFSDETHVDKIIPESLTVRATS